MLGIISTDHYDDIWRFNAIRYLWECGELGDDIIEIAKLRERDREIIEFLEYINSV